MMSGSLGPAGEGSNAQQFFSGIPSRSLDYTSARSDWARGADAMRAAIPMHASYEDKAGVPDRIFFDLDDAAFRRQVASWTRFLKAGTGGPPDIVHLHHLTPMHEAVRSLWPDVPVITHLHGTELKMLASVEDDVVSEAPRRWTPEWVGRMRRWAAESDRLVVVSGHDADLARQLLPGDAARVSTIGNGVDADIFAPAGQDRSGRAATWRRWLVEAPRGWRPGGGPGTIHYGHDDLDAFTDDDGSPVPVVVFAGRFLQFKRLQLLIEAHHLMRITTGSKSVLVIAGGYPGEWEGEHPYDTVQRLGAQGVFFLGWREHDELAQILACGDVFAAPSVDEPFGLVYLEAMAAGLPPIATTTGGPPTFINTRPASPTGWLVPPDDVTATAAALAHAVGDAAERVARGRRASAFVRQHHSWAAAAGAFAELYDEVIAEQHRVVRVSSGPQ
jgi:glycosyltransferase involved in cell wall biosynthesis